MNIVRKRIQHVVFGEGTVIRHENGRITVEFSGQCGVKQFIYPDAFEKHLKMFNQDAELFVLEELHGKQAQIEAEKMRRQQEQEESDRIQALEKSKQSAKKKKPASKTKTAKLKRRNNAEAPEEAEDSEK